MILACSRWPSSSGLRSLGFLTESSDIAVRCWRLRISCAAVLLMLIAAGAPHYFVSNLFGVAVMPALYDVVLLILFGLAISAQPLLFGMTRQLTDPQNTGKALSAVDLAFFLGAALMQSATGMVAAALGLPAVMIFVGLALIVGVVVFLAYT